MEKIEEPSFESFEIIDEEIQSLMLADPPPETGNSFTALLDLPPNQAVNLLNSRNVFFSVFPTTEMENSPETTSSVLPPSSPNIWNLVKQEPIETGSVHNSSPIVSDPIKSKSTKRNNREKAQSSAKKIKTAAKEIDGEKVQFVHVRARRGEATDSHSLAERARREKINTRMKLLQELVPGCNKISGTAMVLDKIINHVQSLQLQVELLSMKLAAVQPDIDINLDNLFSSESVSPTESNIMGMISPSWWVDAQTGLNAQQIWHPEGLTNFVTLESSLLSYGSSGNSSEPGLKSRCVDRPL